MAPAIVDYRPVPAERPEPGRWYSHDLEYGPANVTDLNVFFYGMTLEGARPELTYVSSFICAHATRVRSLYLLVSSSSLGVVPFLSPSCGVMGPALI